MPNQTTKIASSRKEVTAAKFYDNFLETLMRICAEEKVFRVPEIIVVNKSGAQIAEPEAISRKLSQISATLEKERLEEAAEEAFTVPDVINLSHIEPTGKQKVQRAPEVKSAAPVTEPKKKGAPMEKATPQRDSGVTEAEDQISAPVVCPQGEVCRRLKGQLKIVSGQPETLTALAMKGTKIEPALLRSLGKCLSWFPTISQLKLENCRLKPEDAFVIALVLRQTQSLKQLILDENPLGDMCYSCLLQMSSNLQLLSLCGCGMGDLGVGYLCAGLEHTDCVSHPLVRLNLTNNLITCKGAILVANALRTNRALLTVTLSGNQIGNTGAIALAEVFQRFKLRQDECVERRGRYFTQNLTQNSRYDIIQDLYPFLFEMEREGGAQYCKGNFTLVHLNLSYNSIGLAGLLAFHQAVLYQESVLQPPDHGLLAIYFMGNLFSEDRPEVEEILRILDARLEFKRKGSKPSSLDSSRSSSRTVLI